MRVQRRLAGVAIFTLVSSLITNAQQSAQPPDLTIHSTTRLVVVDAIVTDDKSQPVGGLTADDFTVLDDGKPQKVSFFSFESPERRKSPVQLPPLRPGVYTNIPEFHNNTGAPIVILLLDGLNTPPGQKMYARDQMLKYLTQLKLSGPRTAILALGNELSVLQDFTTDSELLIAAARSYIGSRTALDVEAPKIEIPVTTGPGSAPAAANISISDNSGDTAASIASQTKNDNAFAGLAESLQRFDKSVSVDDQNERIRKTLQAFRTIGQAVSGYSGRKSLLWFSAGFPFTLSLNESMDLEFSKTYRDEIHQAAAMLSSSNVAIYPIDTHGLLSSGGLADPTAPTGMGKGAPSTSLAAEAFDKFSLQSTMDSLAHDTGGIVYRNTNDLAGALANAVKDSASYYVLGYYPERKKWDGKFHSIKVETKNRQLKVRARTGYYAIDPSDWRKGQDKELIAADVMHALSATGVLFYAHVIPPEKKGQDTTVEILVDPKTVAFGRGSEGTYTTNLEFQVGAFTPEGKLEKMESQTAEAELHHDTYERFLKTGIPVRIPISLKSGRYLLRVAARDNSNGLIGSLDVPLILP